METTQPPAQAVEGAEVSQDTSGVQRRFDEMTAQRKMAEERAAAAERQNVELAAQMAHLAMQASRPVAPVAAPVDPLAQFGDTLDPIVAQAVRAATENTRRLIEAQYASQFAAQAAQIAGFAVQSEAAAIPGLPKEVTNRAAQLAAQWRSQGINYPPNDAINFALGEYQRGQLLRAAPVAGYNPNAQTLPNVIPGYTPAPAAQVTTALPSNFDQLSRTQQNAILEKNGSLDQAF